MGKEIITMNRLHKYLSLSLLILSPRITLAHPVNMHEQITSNAVFYAQLYSQGYTNFINTISVPSALLVPSTFPLPIVSQSPTAFDLPLVYNFALLHDASYIPGTYNTPCFWMKLGSRKEDDPTNLLPIPQGDSGGYRSLNHFYDPIHIIGLTDPYPYQRYYQPMFLAYGANSFSWASTSNAAGIPLAINLWQTPINHWSWQNARYYEWSGLISSEPSDRSAYLAGIEAVGSVLEK